MAALQKQVGSPACFKVDKGRIWNSSEVKFKQAWISFTPLSTMTDSNGRKKKIKPRKGLSLSYAQLSGEIIMNLKSCQVEEYSI